MDCNSKENVVRFSAGGEEDEEINLKKKISSHPLYELLIETHLDCLKVSLGDIGEVARSGVNQSNNGPNTSTPGCSDLDQFMETYCMVLSELKEAMVEPVQETTAFINAMYFQLTELMDAHPTHTTTSLPTSSVSAGEESSRAHCQGNSFICNTGESDGDLIKEADAMEEPDVNRRCRMATEAPKGTSSTVEDANMSNGKREE